MKTAHMRQQKSVGRPQPRKPRQGKLVIVNDKMQRGYRYFLTEPAGRNFDPEFKPELTPKCESASNWDPAVTRCKRLIANGNQACRQGPRWTPVRRNVKPIPCTWLATSG